MIGKEFLLAGKAIFTLRIPAAFVKQHKCRDHYTFRVDYVEANGKYAETWFIKLLTGPDNSNDYTLFARLNPVSGSVQLIRKTDISEDAWSVKFVRRIFANMARGTLDAIESAGFELMHEGRCGRCGRKLTVPESIEKD